MPHERQLKVRQVYKTLSLGSELIKKSKGNIKFSEMYPVTLSIGDVFKGLNNRNVSCAYACPTSNGLLEILIQFSEKTRKRKRGILTSSWSAKTWHKRVLFPDFFNVFHHNEPFALR